MAEATDRHFPHHGAGQLSTPLFSVIIPTYNRMEKLRRALDSLVAQTFRDFEVIVCDDGSTDGTAEMVETFTDTLNISYLRDENFGGPARPRNVGMAASKGRWICFLDADDWWYPGKLERIVPLLENSDLIFHDCDVVTPQGMRRFVRKSRMPRKPFFVDFMTRGCRIITSSVCVRREILDAVGPFSEDRELIAIEDTDLWIRIARVTEKFVYLPERLGAYWEDGDNISGFSGKFIERITVLHNKFAGFLGEAERRDAGMLLMYRTALVKRSLGHFGESRALFRKTLAARNMKIKVYSMLYLVRMKLNL